MILVQSSRIRSYGVSIGDFAPNAKDPPAVRTSTTAQYVAKLWHLSQCSVSKWNLPARVQDRPVHESPRRDEAVCCYCSRLSPGRSTTQSMVKARFSAYFRIPKVAGEKGLDIWPSGQVTSPRGLVFIPEINHHQHTLVLDGCS